MAIDDLDNAGNVTFNVPGMDTSIHDGLKSWVASGQDLHDTQQKTYHDRRLDNPGTALVSWIGYETPPGPPSPDVLFSSRAEAGAKRLTAALDAFQITLTRTQHPMQTVTFFDSAGIDRSLVPHADALKIDRDGERHVDLYSTMASNDKITPPGRFSSIEKDRIMDARVDPGTASGAPNLLRRGRLRPADRQRLLRCHRPRRERSDGNPPRHRYHHRPWLSRPEHRFSTEHRPHLNRNADKITELVPPEGPLGTQRPSPKARALE